MDYESLGRDAGRHAGKKEGGEDRDLSHEEIEKHGENAAREFAEAMAKHDHAGMWRAFQALDALCEEQMDEKKPEAEEEPEEE